MTDGIVKAEEMEELRRLAQALQIDEPLELLAADLDNKKINLSLRHRFRREG